MTAREMWAAGDYPAVAEYLTSAGEACVRLARIGPGDDVLDVACGNGNATVVAARTGARVTGVDITPELLEAGRASAPEIDWVEGDAEALPFGDEDFDVVISTFGCMFAPDHERAAGELRRVLRPGGRIALASWTPTGNVGGFFATVGQHIPPRPGEPPVLWGTEEHVRALLSGMTLTFDRGAVRFPFASPDAVVDFYAHNFGPLIAARAAADDWDALRADLVTFFADHWSGWGYEGEYLMVAGSS